MLDISDSGRFFVGMLEGWKEISHRFATCYEAAVQWVWVTAKRTHSYDAPGGVADADADKSWWRWSPMEKGRNNSEHKCWYTWSGEQKVGYRIATKKKRRHLVCNKGEMCATTVPKGKEGSWWHQAPFDEGGFGKVGAGSASKRRKRRLMAVALDEGISALLDSMAVALDEGSSAACF